MGLASYTSLDEAVRGCFGDGAGIVSAIRLSGGDINTARAITLTNGERVFVKSNSIENSRFFDAEEEGILAIAETSAIATPKLLAKGTDKAEGISFLMMELIEEGRVSSDTWIMAGHEFADMHLADTKRFVSGGRYGFLHDNYIGATRQINTPRDSWIGFFRQCRLEPQIRMAEKSLDRALLADAAKLLDRLEDLLIEPDRPSLLHGDMWGGNHLIDISGRMVLIDPAAYVGCAEADIAMTQMFGSMPRRFYDAYHEKIPAKEGYSDRKDLYNLYHFLNHFNLFGKSYLSSVSDIIRHYIR